MSNEDLDTKIKRWYFDNYPDSRRDSRGTDKRSWVEFAPHNDDDEAGWSLGNWTLTVYLREEPILTFTGDLDQWGTWIELCMQTENDTSGVSTIKRTVAQEWSTKSFSQALIAGLTEFNRICDFEGKTDRQKPEYEEMRVGRSASHPREDQE